MNRALLKAPHPPLPLYITTHQQLTIIMTSPRPKTIYFAYGSNLSPTQMRNRCPSSPLSSTPLAILHDYEWFIGERGYANIRPKIGKEVVGLLYVMDSNDERRLDLAEGVPWAYERHKLEVEVLGAGEGSGEKRKALVYIDQRSGVGRASEEYIARLRIGREMSEELGLVFGDSWGVGWDEEERREPVSG